MKNHRSYFPHRIGAPALTLALLLALLIPLAAGGQDAPATGAAPQDIVHRPDDLPAPVGDRAPTTVKFDLTVKEVIGRLYSTDITYHYWTFNGTVPGPMLRVRQGDTVEVTVHNPATNSMEHSLDMHAVLGASGGAEASTVKPGESKTFTFRATTPGIFLYHCGTSMVAEHIANGMFGLVVVEPPGGLPHVDHEYYVVQSELYTDGDLGDPGLRPFSMANLLKEQPTYYVFNGAVGALTTEYPLHSEVGQTVRIFFGDAGPEHGSSFHIIGEILSKVTPEGSLTSPPLTNVQTTFVPPGSATMIEFQTRTPGHYMIMDHALARIARGLVAMIHVTGKNPDGLFHPGPPETEEPKK